MESKIPSKDQLYIFDLSEKVVKSLELLYFDSETSEEVQLKTDGKPEEVSVSKTPQSSKPKDVNYYKSDLHKYNLKRNVLGLPPLTEDEFDEVLEKQSIESLSGSESEAEEDDEEEDEKVDQNELKLKALISKLSLNTDSDERGSVSYLNTKSPFILFKSNLLSSDSAFGAYKSLFSNSELLNSPLEALKGFSKLKEKKSALFMIGGGHFAGAIISHKQKSTKGNAPNMKVTKEEQAVDILTSKTFHRYTTRRKQGGAQSANDNAKGKANSAGAGIRRYNEQALITEIRELLQEWKSYLSECSSIYIRANGAANRKILVGYEGSVLQNDDARIKSFPFTTKRATTSELKRAWIELTYLKPVELPKVNEKLKKKLETEKLQVQQSGKDKPKTPEPLSIDETHSIEIINLLKKQKAPKLLSYVKQNKISVNEFRLKPDSKYIATPTLLHYASANSLNHMVQILLVNLKADPTLFNQVNRYPIEVASDITTRNVFQICRQKLGEDYCDWDSAKVGPPKSKEEFESEEKAEAERIKSEKQQRIKEELARKTELEMKKPSIVSSGSLGGSRGLINDLNSLSEDQKLRIMREQRARAAEARFKQ
ncbi:hypothetical protein DFJ63DRAFT_370 [Scheffersomyces coipomensis]|uniref:uncharacterized protein n=1 Tax=Scheffersomyces coipomensis TaxID=1788519 RepID=UPI00315DD5CB